MVLDIDNQLLRSRLTHSLTEQPSPNPTTSIPTPTSDPSSALLNCRPETLNLLRSEFSDDAIAELQAEDPEIGKAYEVMSENLDPQQMNSVLCHWSPDVFYQCNLRFDYKITSWSKKEMEECKSSFQWHFEKGCLRLLTTQHTSDHVALTNSWTHPTIGTGCVKTRSVGIINVNTVPKAKDHHFVHMVNYRRYLLALQWIWSPWTFSQVCQQLMMDQSIYSWSWTLSQSGWKLIHFRTKRPRRASQLSTMECSPDSDCLVNCIQIKVETLRVNWSQNSVISQDNVKTRTTAFHPRSDGLTERANRTILAMLRAATYKDTKKWPSKLP